MASVRSASRSASVSPTQTTGNRPAASATPAFAATSASLSPYSVRRSEWPTQHEAAANVGEHVRRHLAGEGPLLRPGATLAAETYRSVPDGRARVGDVDERRTHADIDRRQSARTLAHSATSARASSREPFIFQLPATNGRRMPMSPVPVRHSVQSGKKVRKRTGDGPAGSTRSLPLLLESPVAHQTLVAPALERFDVQRDEHLELLDERGLERLGHRIGIAMRPAERLGDDPIDQAPSSWSRSDVMPIAWAASGARSALFHRIEAHPSGEITE